EGHTDLQLFRARGPDNAVQIVARLDVNRDAVPARGGDGLEVLRGRLGHQMTVDHPALPVDLIRDGLEDDRPDRDRLDEVTVAHVEMEDADTGAHEHVDLLAQPREV